MIKAVLFDVDGVLYDSIPLHAKAWQKAFGLIDFHLPIKEVHLQEGRPDPEFARAVIKKYKIKNVPNFIIEKMADKKVLEFERYRKLKIIRGVKSLITNLKRHDLKIGIVTGSSQPKTMKRLEKDFGIDRRYIVTGKEVDQGKPHPEPFLKAAKKLQVKPSECLVVENAPLGITAARRARMKCVAINSGILPDGILRKAGAKIVYKSYNQIMKHWTKLLLN